MSDQQPITLDLLGRIVRDMQMDVRDLKTRVAVLEIDVTGVKVAVAQLANRVAESEHKMLAGIAELGASNQRVERLLAELVAKA